MREKKVRILKFDLEDKQQSRHPVTVELHYIRRVTQVVEEGALSRLQCICKYTARVQIPYSSFMRPIGLEVRI